MNSPTDRELLPCPFCGCTLAPDTESFYAKRYGTYYVHPSTDCYLTDADVAPNQVAEWNRRAAYAIAGEAAS